MTKFKKLLGVALITSFLGITAATGAYAHVEVVKTSPSTDATVNAPLAQISITLNESPLLDGSAITISNQDGSPVDTAAVALEGTKLYVPWPADIAVGDITVDYRVASDDGHVVDGTFTFTYTGAATSGVSSEQPSPVPSVTESTTASPEPSEVVSALAETPTLIATPMPVTVEDQLGDQSPGGKTWIWVGVAAFVLITGGLLFLRRKK